MIFFYMFFEESFWLSLSLLDAGFISVGPFSDFFPKIVVLLRLIDSGTNFWMPKLNPTRTSLKNLKRFQHEKKRVSFFNVFVVFSLPSSIVTAF